MTSATAALRATSAVARPVQVEESTEYAKEYWRIVSEPLRDELHRLAHDHRIQSGKARAWALRYLRWRAGDLDGNSRFVDFPAPPSDTIGVDGCVRLFAVCDELIPDFRGARWKRLRRAGDHRSARGYLDR